MAEPSGGSCRLGVNESYLWLDLRERIVAACEAGASQASVATRFGVCAKTVQRLVARAAAGQLARAPIAGRRARLCPEQEEQLVSLLNEDVNWTVAQVCQVWQQRTGQHVPRSTMHDAMRRVGARFKKSRIKKKSHRP